MTLTSDQHKRVRYLPPLGATLAFACAAMLNATSPGQAAIDPGPAPESIAMGKELYSTVCLTCHGANLEGGEGPRLTDAEWLHGGTREQIMASINNGFAEEGMPAFGALYGPMEAGAIADYILSQQIGWRKVGYAVRPVPAGDVATFDIATLAGIAPAAQGEFADGLADFSKADLPTLAVTFEGDIMVPAGEPKVLLVGNSGKLAHRMTINGQAVTSLGRAFGEYYAIAPGTHRVAITYLKLDPSVEVKQFSITVAENDGTKLVAPLSRAAKQIMDSSVVKITAKEAVRIFQRPVRNLPFKSISVGFPSGINYAFNPVSCSVVGAWQGDFLNIGPNVVGRGAYPSEPLGRWLFHSPEILAVESSDGGCRYDSMSTLSEDGAPEFRFSFGEMKYTLTGEESDGGLLISINRDGSNDGQISVKLPAQQGDGVLQSEISIVEQTADTVRVMVR